MDSEDEEQENNNNDYNVETGQPQNIEEDTPTTNQAYPEYERSSQLNDKNLENKVAKLQPKIKIKYKVNENDNLQSAEIISRAGKLSGKNRNWRNIENQSGNQQSLNFEKIHHFELIDTNDNTNDPELLEKMPRLSLENIPKSVETSQDETQIHETLLKKNNSYNLEAKQKSKINGKRKEFTPNIQTKGKTVHPYDGYLKKNLSMIKR